MDLKDTSGLLWKVCTFLAWIGPGMCYRSPQALLESNISKANHRITVQPRRPMAEHANWLSTLGALGGFSHCVGAPVTLPIKDEVFSPLAT